MDRQFEFVQHSWSNNQKFAGSYDEVDPIIGVMVKGKEVQKAAFEVPQFPVRKRYQEIPPFVTTRGGEYFFLPSLSFIPYLAQNFRN